MNALTTPASDRSGETDLASLLVAEAARCRARVARCQQIERPTGYQVGHAAGTLC
jgi:hypothetical protein